VVVEKLVRHEDDRLPEMIVALSFLRGRMGGVGRPPYALSFGQDRCSHRREPVRHRARTDVALPSNLGDVNMTAALVQGSA
jgi:hypothetical protein